MERGHHDENQCGDGCHDQHQRSLAPLAECEGTFWAFVVVMPDVAVAVAGVVVMRRSLSVRFGSADDRAKQDRPVTRGAGR